MSIFKRNVERLSVKKGDSAVEPSATGGFVKYEDYAELERDYISMAEAAADVLGGLSMGQYTCIGESTLSDEVHKAEQKSKASN